MDCGSVRWRVSESQCGGGTTYVMTPRQEQYIKMWSDWVIHTRGKSTAYIDRQHVLGIITRGEMPHIFGAARDPHESWVSPSGMTLTPHWIKTPWDHQIMSALEIKLTHDDKSHAGTVWLMSEDIHDDTLRMMISKKYQGPANGDHDVPAIAKEARRVHAWLEAMKKQQDDDAWRGIGSNDPNDEILTKYIQDVKSADWQYVYIPPPIYVDPEAGVSIYTQKVRHTYTYRGKPKREDIQVHHVILLRDENGAYMDSPIDVWLTPATTPRKTLKALKVNYDHDKEWEAL
jgi:hypothetical protein